jgi:periplasmic protein TonB
VINRSKFAWSIALGVSVIFHGLVFIGIDSSANSPTDIGGAGQMAPVWGIPGSQFDVAGEDAPEIVELHPPASQAPATVTPVLTDTESVAAETVREAPAETQTVAALTMGNIALLPVTSTTEMVLAEPTEIEAEILPPMPQLNPRPPQRARPNPPENNTRQRNASNQQNTRASTINNQPATAPSRQWAGTGQATGSMQSRATAPGAAEISSYSGRVASHLQRRKRYPRAAARQRLSGSVGVRFTINKSGRVTAVRITNLTGDPIFREEVLAMVNRANPFPAIPANFNTSSMSFNVTIRFAPR